nr:MAG TPA: hypothetical protein [Caudoviricetes sp.]
MATHQTLTLILWVRIPPSQPQGFLAQMVRAADS